jgi:hypothetical protein
MVGIGSEEVRFNANYDFLPNRRVLSWWLRFDHEGSNLESGFS